jgi:hypothetical protein
MTTFQIVRIDEDQNEEILLDEQSNSSKLKMSLKAAFEVLEGENVRLLSWEKGSMDVEVLGRGGVLTAAGKKAMSKK